MSNKIKIPLIVVGSLAILYFALSSVGIFRYYRMVTISGYPTLKQGDIFFVSTLKKPKRFDLVCFYADIPDEGHVLVVHRLCGLPGDKVELIDGTLFINGQNADKNLDLSHLYTIPAKDEYKVLDYEPLEDNFISHKSYDSLVVNFSDKTVLDNQLHYPKYTEAEIPNASIYEVYQKAWNADNFGPIIIPNGHYFVLGDNRPNSMDSRYLGPIDQKNHYATVLFK